MQIRPLSQLLVLFLFLITHPLPGQDWANLNRFKMQNQELGAPARNENRIVFMGNSITEAWSSLMPEFFRGKPYINRGISGQTTPQMLVRFRQDVIDLNPKVVVILAGTNDIAGNTGPMTLDQIADNIKSMAELAHSNKIKVVICSVLPVYDYPWKPGLEPANKIIELNEMIHRYASEQGHIYLDYFSKMVDVRNGLPKDLAEDGVHPNKKGYEIMAKLAESAVKKALK